MRKLTLTRECVLCFRSLLAVPKDAVASVFPCLHINTSQSLLVLVTALTALLG